MPIIRFIMSHKYTFSPASWRWLTVGCQIIAERPWESYFGATKGACLLFDCKLTNRLIYFNILVCMGMHTKTKTVKSITKFLTCPYFLFGLSFAVIPWRYLVIGVNLVTGVLATEQTSLGHLEHLVSVV